MSSVVVLGSVNVDAIWAVAKQPQVGQTVEATVLGRALGGKGANQATASARAGAATTFIAAVGEDEEGRTARQELAADDLAGLVRQLPGATGSALVIVNAAGDNTILIAPGANAGMVALNPGENRAIAEASVLLCQLEIPVEGVLAACRTARDAGTLTVLNAAPAAPMTTDLDPWVDLLVVNETEALELAGLDAATDLAIGTAALDRVFDTLLARFPLVVVTLGAGGVMFADRDGHHHIPAVPVTVVDTTAAGDTFCGYLAAGLAAGDPLDQAVRRAVSAAAVCVGRPGAAGSIPYRHDVIDPPA